MPMGHHEGSFYVYEHVRPDTGEVFYVGKGKGKRALQFKRGHNQHYNGVVARLADVGLAVTVVMVATDLTEDYAFRLERERIAYWRALGVGLSNRTDGGEGTAGHVSPLKGKPPSPSVVERLRALAAAQKGKPLSPEHLAKLSAAQVGRKHTPEVRAKIAESNRRRPQSAETGARISASNIGKHGGPKSAATRARMRKPKSAEHRASMSKPKSAETRARMSEAMRRRWADAKASGAGVLWGA